MKHFRNLGHRRVRTGAERTSYNAIFLASVIVYDIGAPKVPIPCVLVTILKDIVEHSYLRSTAFAAFDDDIVYASNVGAFEPTALQSCGGSCGYKLRCW